MANIASTSVYGQKLRAYENPKRMLASQWAKNEPGNLKMADKASANWRNYQGAWTQRDTIALCEESSHRRVLCGVNWVTHGKLLGRDVEPKVGMIVRLTTQGLDRRIRAQRGGAIGPTAQHFKAKEMPRPWTGDAGGARDAIGVVVAVPSTWTCDVGWANGETGSGYSCGGQAGKGGRAFHLEMVEPVRQEAIKVLSERDVQRMALAQFGSRKTKIIS